MILTSMLPQDGEGRRGMMSYVVEEGMSWGHQVTPRENEGR
jgi:hypothetical protein